MLRSRAIIRLRIRILFVALLSITSCVAHVEIDGAPCPCPSGFICCPTLLECVSSATDCPTTYPPSSKTKCSNDDDCPHNAVCQSWTVKGGILSGPAKCHRTCLDDFLCSEGESCELILHNGQPIEQVNLVRACTSETTIPGCEQCGCSDCEVAQIGRTFCDDTVVRGCLLALDPVCGVDCKMVVVQDCLMNGLCENGSNGARCISIETEPNGPCQEFSCSVCDSGTTSGSVSCEDESIARCLSMPYFSDEECDQICQVISEKCPQGMTCIQGEIGPFCDSE